VTARRLSTYDWAEMHRTVEQASQATDVGGPVYGNKLTTLVTRLMATQAKIGTLIEQVESEMRQ